MILLHQLDSSFHQRNKKIKGDHLDLSKDTANTTGSQTLTLYYTLPVKMGCIVQHVCCFTQKPRDSNQGVLVYKPYTNWKTLSLICKITVGLSHIGCQKQKWIHLSPHTCSHHQKFIHSLYNLKSNCGKEQKIPYLNCEVS